LAQETQNILSEFINLDAAFESLAENESPFIKDLSNDLNANPDLGIGTDNPTGEGQSTTVLTPTRSNVAIPDVLLPDGYNKTILAGESATTQEMYVANFNGNGQHGIYVYSGNTGLWQQVIIDPELLFTDLQEAYISEHRFTLRTRTNAANEIIEKYLLFTDGTTYHKWIDVIAAIKTNGFDVTLYAYFALQPPHFDRQELLAWAVRSPMIAPKVTPLPNTIAEKGKPNKILGQAFEFCYQDIFTDGRQTLSSPFSLPAIVKQTDFLTNPDLIPKRLNVLMDAGSCKTEKRNIFIRTTAKKSDSTLDKPFSDWYLYDTINKFTDSGSNSFAVIGNDYWKRTGGWSQYNYNSVKNIIEYVFDNSKLPLITGQEFFEFLDNEMPQLSVAMSNLGDATQLANNRYGFDNFSNEITDKFSTEVVENLIDRCQVPTREIKLYVYAARERGNSSEPSSARVRGIWLSQVGYIDGQDTQERWGGMFPNGNDLNSQDIEFDVDESKYFDLNFADKDGFRCYLKGTQYYADCEWYLCRQDFTLQKIAGKIDRQNTQDLSYVTNSIKNLGFFVGVFTFKVPAGRYTATLGRHNVASDGDYRGTSTYIMGIANSRQASISTYLTSSFPVRAATVNTVKQSALVTVSKEIEIDCTAGDVDVWGRGAQGDLFYVFTPFLGRGEQGLEGQRNRWQFVEGYLYESEIDKVPVERFPYAFERTGGERGIWTDKNGFFFANTWGGNSDQADQDIVFTIKKDCAYPFDFTVTIENGATWKRNIEVFFDTYNGGVVGSANRVLLEGYVRDLTNTIPYSNIGVSLVGTETAYTDSNGFFSIIVHNGLNNTRVDNIYINAAGNFTLSTAGCGFVPLFVYTEPTCQTTQPRRVPIIVANVNAQNGEATSLKAGASYLVGVVGADIACRVTYVNKFSLQDITSFPQRNNTNATQIKWLLSGNIQLQNDIRTRDIKWLAFYIINATNYKRYLQWVGDLIEFIDANGNVTTSSASASLVRINISSLLETNIKNNFTLLSNYQFQQADRIRVFDNGLGQLLNTTTYGDLIDLEIQGTNYNQAAINANLIPPSENVVLNANSVAGTDPTTIYVKYDRRFDALKDKTGFWIEVYTPQQTTEILPLSQVESFFPIINGEIAEYVGGGVSNPVYTFPTQGVLNYWDTYLIRRNIIGLGQFISHPFESPNITDSWGANVTSGGKTNTINANAQRLWYNDNTIKSDDYITNGIINGLAFFRSRNKKDFKGYQRGGIVAISCQYSVILFICENDWFVTDYNFQYIFANAQGIQVANLDQNLSVPHQKVGNNYGCRLQDTASILLFDKYVWWIDTKNQSAIICDYREAVDVSDISGKDETGKSEKKFGIKSYLYEKLKVIENWNSIHAENKRFDIVCGIDEIRNNIYVTFRPRRNNSNNALSFVNRRRNIDLMQQETVVYNLDKKRWTKFTGCTPEAYGKVRGNQTGIEFISFAAGKPYLQNKVRTSFVNFFGVQLEPCLIMVCNKSEDVVKILQAVSMDINNSTMYSDLIYSTQDYGYSYLPLNYFKEEEKMFYAPFLKDMVSYLQNPVPNDFRSTLIDGKRIFGEYFLIRFVHEYGTLGHYFELNKASLLYTSSVPVKPPAT